MKNIYYAIIVYLLILGCSVNANISLNATENEDVPFIMRMNSLDKLDSLNSYINKLENNENLVITSQIKDTIVFNINDLNLHNVKTKYNIFISKETESMVVIFRCKADASILNEFKGFEAKTGGKIIPNSNFYIENNIPYFEAIMLANSSILMVENASYRLASITLNIKNENPVEKTFNVRFYY